MLERKKTAMQKIKRTHKISRLFILPGVWTWEPHAYLGAKIGVGCQPKQNVYFHPAKCPQ